VGVALERRAAQDYGNRWFAESRALGRSAQIARAETPSWCSVASYARHCRPSTSRVLWMEPNGRAYLLTAHEAASKPTRECYALADVVDGVQDAIRRLRRSHDYAVWNGAKAVPVQELMAV